MNKPKTAIEAIQMVDAAARYFVDADINDVLDGVNEFRQKNKRDPNRPPMWMRDILIPIVKEAKK